MKIESSSATGNFKITNGSTVRCEVIYKNWFTGKAQTRLDGNDILMMPKNIWTSKVDIFKNKEQIGDITCSLKGFMVIRLKDSTGEHHFILKNTGFLKLKFEFQDDSENVLFTLISKNKWSKLNYDYQMENAAYHGEVALEELLIYCGYAANLYLAVIS